MLEDVVFENRSIPPSPNPAIEQPPQLTSQSSMFAQILENESQQMAGFHRTSSETDQSTSNLTDSEEVEVL